MQKTQKRMLIAATILLILGIILSCIAGFLLENNGDHSVERTVVGCLAAILLAACCIIIIVTLIKGKYWWFFPLIIISLGGFIFDAIPNLYFILSYNNNLASKVIIFLPSLIFFFITYGYVVYREKHPKKKAEKQESKQKEGICPYCGSELEVGAKSCSSCGVRRLRA